MFFDLSKTLEKKNFIREDLKKYDNWKPWKNITQSRSRVAKYEKTNKQKKKVFKRQKWLKSLSSKN